MLSCNSKVIEVDFLNRQRTTRERDADGGVIAQRPNDAELLAAIRAARVPGRRAKRPPADQ
jgi:hypothetical protein